MSVERETKLDVGPGFRLPGFDDVRPELEVHRAEPVRTRTVYWDTADLRLARWGCSLRHRDGQGWTLKLPPEESEGALERDELVAKGPPSTPPGRLVDLTTAYVRTVDLRPALTLSTVRTTVAFTGSDRTPVGEVVDDEVAVLDGRRIAARFREVEVETHDDALAGAAIARLRAAGAGETVLTPKYLRALGPWGAEPPELTTVERLPEDATMRDAIANALAASVIRLIHADPVVRIDEDPEGVHRARVAVRRLRSDLRTFRAALDPGWREQLRPELRWLGGALGDVRDLDVLTARLARRVAELAPGDRASGERLVKRARGERADARERLVADLASTRYRTLLDRLVAAAADPAVTAEWAERPAAAEVEPIMSRPWGHLSRACRSLGADPLDQQLHEARIRAKRARYAADALAPVAGPDARRFARRAAELQDVLGAHQDAVVATAWLRTAARASPSSAFVAGILVAREDLERADARRRWSKAWKHLRRKKERFWS